jgi:predicted ArsR family transcriptional regulator
MPKERDDIVVSQSQLTVYNTLRQIGPTTDQDLIYTLREEGHPISESGVRTRRDELVKMGLVREYTSVKARNAQGKTLKVWKTTQKKVDHVRE